MKKKLSLLILFLISQNLLSNDLKISLNTNYKNFKPGQAIKIQVSLPPSSYLYIFVLKNDGSLNLLYPNREESDNLILEDTAKIPSPDKDYDFIAGDNYGVDSIFAVASRNRIAKLHKEKYQNTAVYKNIRAENLNWLRKITKHSHPDHWTFAETKIFISRDGISENSKLIPLKKNKPKTIVPIKSEEIFLSDEFMKGNFRLPENHFGESLRGKFVISKKEEEFSLTIIPYLDQRDSTCEYKILSNSKPVPVPKSFGNIEAEKLFCKMESLDSEKRLPWTEFKNIFIQYELSPSGKLKGNLWFIGANDKFNSRLSNLSARNPF
jgi:hypothetical protein